MPSFTSLDYLAIGWFLLWWMGYVRLADHTKWQRRNISSRMDEYRQLWMRNMLHREMRMVDTMIHGSLVSGVAFFASTSILMVGGLLAALGATDEAVAVLSDLPLGVPVSRGGWEIKVLLMVIIFIHAFFKFAWCYRLFNYCAVMVGAAPRDSVVTAEDDVRADQIARLYSLAGRHFQNGLRSYFFALAAIAWFLHPVLFIVSTAWVAWVLYRREFRSRALDIIQDDKRAR